MIQYKINEILQNKNTLMLITAFIFMGGILSYFNNTSVICAGILTVIAIIAIIKNLFPIKYIFLWIAIFYLGFFNSLLRIKTTDALVAYAPTKAKIQGQIVSNPNGNDKKIKFFFKVNKINDENINGKTLVTLSETDFSNIKIGNYYEFTGKLRIPFKSTNPSQFDYGKYLQNFGTYTVFYANNASSINANLTFKWIFQQKLNDLRNRIIKVHSKYLKSPNLEILGGIVFGDDAVNPPDYVKTSFTNSGLLHILAASGMNVAFIYGFWVFFMRRLKIPFKITIISGIFLIIGYTFMTGLGPSVIRAALMLIFILLGKLIDRDANSVSLLAFVAMLMLMYNPALINNVSFQLSFIVTLGLLSTANIIFDKCKNSKIPNWLLGVILIPIIAQIWVIPIQMFYFNTISTYSVIANVLSMPFLSVVSFGGFLTSIIAIFSPFTDKICLCLDFILNYVLKIIIFISDTCGSFYNSVLTTIHPNIMQILLYYSIILIITYIIKNGHNKKLLATAILILLTLFISVIKIPDNKLEIITFDVQNADCFLIKTPQNKYFIIDTGKAGYKGSKAQANSIILKYLKDNGIKEIEGLILTHFDNDHTGGACDIIKNLQIKEVYVNSYDDTSITSKNIYKIIKEKHLTSKIPKNNTSIYIEPNVNIKTYFSNLKDENEKSIITLLTYKNFDMIFMGDAGTKSFEKIKHQIPRNIEVLKVGHHGGANVVNKSMIDYLNTKVSIISTGTNSFGHPYKGTLDILRVTNIYRTDRNNSIKLKSNGNTYSIYTYAPEKHKYILSKQLLTN